MFPSFLSISLIYGCKYSMTIIFIAISRKNIQINIITDIEKTYKILDKVISILKMNNDKYEMHEEDLTELDNFQDIDEN